MGNESHTAGPFVAFPGAALLLFAYHARREQLSVKGTLTVAL
jgi:hypothetical protein